MPVPHMNAREYTLLMGELKKVFQNACSSFNARVHLLDRRNEKGIQKCLFRNRLPESTTS